MEVCGAVKTATSGEKWSPPRSAGFETFDRLAPSVTEGFIIGANRLPIEISPIHLTA
jgi:hypothetical protein